MQYAAQQANVQALDKAVAAARSNAAAFQANLARLNELHGYLTVRAPFAGVITVRNIDVGALVNEGSTLLYRIAQTDRLRTYVNVPQADSSSVRVGQHATLSVSDLGGRKFPGQVTRTSNALDPATRTLLVEVQVDNSSGALMPGMYAQVDLAVPRADPPLVDPRRYPGGARRRSAGGGGGSRRRVHFTQIQLGRDFGATIEVLDGLEERATAGRQPQRRSARRRPDVSPRRPRKRPRQNGSQSNE